MKFIQNKYDKFIFIGISFAIYNMFLVWLLANVAKTSNVIVWIASIPVSLFIAYRSAHFYSFEQEEISKKTQLLYFLFFTLLGWVLLYYIEPLLRYPYSTIGIPFKDMQDAMAAFISDYGYQPTNDVDTPNTSFITNIFFTSHQPYYQNIYFGYPNVLHTFSALFMKLGIFEFHATWIATTTTILTTSCSLFLILKSFKKVGYAAVVAGLFGLSSYRLPYSIIASIVMAFSIGLIIPVLLFVLIAVHHFKDNRSYLLPVIALSLLAASFTNAIAFVLGILSIYIFLLFMYKKRGEVNHILRIIGLFILTIPVYIGLFTLVGSTYFGGTFHAIQNNADFDPYELSQRILPFDRPSFMIFYGASMALYLYLLIKKRYMTEQHMLQNLLFIVNIGLLIPIIYDGLFTRINSIQTAQDLVRVAPAGLFGGLFHFLMHRVALLQPIFFIFFVGELFSHMGNKWGKLSLLMIMILFLSGTVLRTNGMIYETIQNELITSFYNAQDSEKKYTLLSHWRLITDENMWNKSIIKSLNYLKQTIPENTNILLLDRRDWSEETVANWGSMLLRSKISRPRELYIGEDWKKDITSYVGTIKEENQYVLEISKGDSKENAPQLEIGERIFSESGVTLFKIH